MVNDIKLVDSNNGLSKCADDITISVQCQSNLFSTDTKGTGISVRIIELGFIWISVSQGPSELSVIERCPY